VELRLEVEGAGTRLHLSHQSGPRSRNAYEKKAQIFESSWTLVFAALEAHLGPHGA
jgi:hypothetical protein